MSVNPNSTTTLSDSSRHWIGRGRLALLGGAAVIVAVAGLGLWARSDTGDSSSPSRSNAQASIDSIGAPASTHAATSTAQVSRDHGLVYIYIVGSDAEAANLRNAAHSVPGWPSQVVVASSHSEAEFEATAFFANNDVRGVAGQPQVRALVVGELATAQ